jgi:hypothetical protein
MEPVKRVIQDISYTTTFASPIAKDVCSIVAKTADNVQGTTP